MMRIPPAGKYVLVCEVSRSARAEPAGPTTARRRSRKDFSRVGSSLAALIATVTFGGQAFAQTVYGQVYVTNHTQFTFNGLTSSVSGKWSTANQPQNNPYYDGWTVGGAPAGVIGPGQQIIFESESNGGVATGTGGSLTIPGVGTISYTVPWGYFHGLPNTYCDSSINTGGGFTVASVSGGLSNAVGANECPFFFDITSGSSQALSTGGLLAGQALAQGTSFTSVANSDGTKALQLQRNGNLALLDKTVSPPSTIWASNTTTGDVAYMGSDGNFVLYDINGDAIWQSYTRGNSGASLYVGYFDLNLVFVYSSKANFISWMSPGGYDPTTALWWNQSVDYNSPSIGDWNYGSYKGTCLTGEPIVGVSRYLNSIQSHDIECGGARYVTTASSCYLRSLGSNDDRGYSDNGWDWDSGSYKVECSVGEYVEGISQTTWGQLDGVLCCPGNAYVAGTSQQLQHKNCDTQVFYNGDSSAYRSPDWDSGYYKGQCPGGQYVAGISTPAFSSVGTYGAAHAILCCSPN
jgi:hypothetical protein